MTNEALGTALDILLWVLVLVNSVVLVALVRQVGILLLRVGQVAPPRSGSGPTVGDVVSSLGEEAAEFRSSEGERRLALIASTTCGTCLELVPAVNSLAEAHPEIDFLWVSDSSLDQFLNWSKRKRVSVPWIARPGIVQDLALNGTPYAVVVNRRGTVLASAGVNHLDHIEFLIRSCAADPDHERQTRQELPLETRVSSSKSRPEGGVK